MTPERLRLISELYDAAATMDPGERMRFIDECCAGDDELRRDLNAAFHESAAGFAGAVEEAAAAVVDAADAGRRIGKYRIIRVLGEGGMGMVYEAEQEQPRRIVALKVIKPGLASSELVRRFERESEVLARLQHPGIAQIYEAGAADAGFGPQPYFAMEFIHGVPLTDYAAARALTIRQRLELIAKVCDAVEHAHQRGIIHRDLKPANILVDDAGQPKILDFGVARATVSDAQATRQTDIGQLVGTLAYMSPEQVTGDPLELDTRSDVYALGVILYELLVNRLPYELSHQLPEAVRTIRDQDATKLSSISRAYRGDVETIVAKALEKDKGRRYTSAAALATDIRRYLVDEPIMARPASTAYQLRKFARRHKALVIATAAVFAVLVAGVIVSTREAVKARRAEQTAQAVSDFLQNDLLAQAGSSTQASPSTKPDPDLKVRTALDRAAARIAGKFKGQPEVEAEVRDTIGKTYVDLGLYPEARTQLERALELQRQALGPQNPKTLETLNHVGAIDLILGRFPEAEALLSQALESLRRMLGPERPETLKPMNNLANLYLYEGKYAEAEALFSRTLEIGRRVWGPEHPNSLTCMHNLANVYSYEGKYAEASDLQAKALDIQRHVLGEEHPDVLRSMSDLALSYLADGKYGPAEMLEGQTLESQRRVLGPEHPDTLKSTINLADIYGAQGKYAEAERLNSQVLEGRRHTLGPQHPDTLVSMGALALDFYNEGKYAQAGILQAQTLELSRRVLGPEHRTTLITMNNLADAYSFRGKFGPAEALFEEAVDIGRRVLGPAHPVTLAILGDFAAMYQREGRYDLAETHAAEVLAGRRHALGEEHSDTMSSANDLALAYVSEGKFAESEPLAQKTLEYYRKKQPDDLDRFRAESLLGATLAGQKKFADAEPLLLEGYQGILARKDRVGLPNRYHLDLAHEWIVQLYRAWGKPEKAAEWRSRH